MIVGFTGTQTRPSVEQISTLTDLVFRLAKYAPGDELIVHHGACVGADKIFHDAMVVMRDDLQQTRIKIHAHPSNIRGKVADHSKADFIHPAKPPLDRNPDIIKPSDLLVACPKEFQDELRSGTWTTVRYARKRGIRILFVWPDGSVSEEAPTGNRLE